MIFMFRLMLMYSISPWKKSSGFILFSNYNQIHQKHEGRRKDFKTATYKNVQKLIISILTYSFLASYQAVLQYAKWFEFLKENSFINISNNQSYKFADCQVWNGNFVSSPPTHRLAAPDSRNIRCWHGKGTRFLLYTIWRNSTVALVFSNYYKMDFYWNETNLLIHEDWKPIFAPNSGRWPNPWRRFSRRGYWTIYLF